MSAAILSEDVLSPEPNDGLVTVTSATWGTFLGCIPADHLDEVGQLLGDAPGLVPGGLIAFTYIPEQGRSFGAHTRVHASGEVRGWLEHAGLRELEHREFIAYHGDGGPVRYGLVVARDAREPRPWPTALRWICARCSSARRGHRRRSPAQISARAWSRASRIPARCHGPPRRRPATATAPAARCSP